MLKNLLNEDGILLKEHFQKEITDFLIRRPEVLFAYIFGSFVNSDHYHDIDVAVYLDKGFNFNDLEKYPYGYESLFVGELSRLVHKDVDFVVMNKAGIVLPQRIVNKGLLLFSKDDRMRIEYENYIRRLYIDTEYLRRIQSYYLARHIDNA